MVDQLTNGRPGPPSGAGTVWPLLATITKPSQLAITNNGHTVPAPDGGPGLPFVNWSTTGGDLRIVHFFGMHAMQALPILGFLLDRSGIGAGRNVMVATAVVWLAAMGGLLMLALQGRPLLAL